MAQKYRLKHGAHVQGVIGDLSNPERRFFANDPLRNIVESEEDLATQEPTRWERLASMGTYSGSDLARMQTAQSELSGEAARNQARQLREMAEALERRAEKDELEKEKHLLATSTASPGVASLPTEEAPLSSSASGLSGTGLPPNIDNLSTNDLKTLAAEKKIDLRGTTKREDILRAVKGARG